MTTDSLQVGSAYSSFGAGYIKIQDGPIRFESRTGTYNPVWAVNGEISLIHTTMTVALGQEVSFQAGADSASGTGTLNMDRASFEGVGGLFAGVYDNRGNGAYGYANINNSHLKFSSFDSNGNLYKSTFGIGETGLGSATFSDSTVDAWRFRAGNGTGGVASVLLQNASITAHSNESTTLSPAGIVIGRDGKATLEMFNSSLNAQRIYIGTQGVLKRDGFLNGDPLTGGSAVTVENHGIISPGHSRGVLNIDGNLDLTGTSALEMEVDLSDPKGYDQILTSGNVNFGGTLRLKALGTGTGTGTFDPTLSYTFLTGLNFTGSFSKYEIDPAFGIAASAFSFNGGTFGINPQPVPEPAALAPLALALLALRRRRRA